MTSVIEAVVFDIGGVLEVIDDSVFPGAWPVRLGLTDAEFGDRIGGLTGDPVIGEVTWDEVHAHWIARLALDRVQAREVADDFWRWYAGTLDQPLLDWFVAVRQRCRTAILSNSGPGAREREAHHGFEAIVDDLVYSHEVGLKKPDPAVFALSAQRLGVRPERVLFLDDLAENVAAARAAGWQAVLHTSTPASIEEMERILASG